MMVQLVIRCVGESFILDEVPSMKTELFLYPFFVPIFVPTC